jgi:hypothetical protein
MAIYVREGAGGTGVSWANALSDLPTTFVRGETYYVADGSYGSHTFGTVGTSVITIKKATATDHGIETGWSAEYGDGQALFAAGWTFSTSYWNVDGQFGSLDGTFGFKVKRTNSDGKCVTINTGANYINLSYLDLDNAGYSGLLAVATVARLRTVGYTTPTERVRSCTRLATIRLTVAGSPSASTWTRTEFMARRSRSTRHQTQASM